MNAVLFFSFFFGWRFLNQSSFSFFFVSQPNIRLNYYACAAIVHSETHRCYFWICRWCFLCAKFIGNFPLPAEMVMRVFFWWSMSFSSNSSLLRYYVCFIFFFCSIEPICSAGDVALSAVALTRVSINANNYEIQKKTILPGSCAQWWHF